MALTLDLDQDRPPCRRYCYSKKKKKKKEKGPNVIFATSEYYIEGRVILSNIAET